MCPPPMRKLHAFLRRHTLLSSPLHSSKWSFCFACRRYDHFATLCETLPASIPSLAVNLLAVTHGYANHSLKEQLFKGLNCGITSGAGSYVRDTDMQGSFLSLDSDPFLWDQFSRCMFAGSQFYRMLFRWHVLEKEIIDFLTLTKTRKGKLNSLPSLLLLLFLFSD